MFVRKWIYLASCFVVLTKAELCDIAVVQLDHAPLIHGFHELHGVIDRYIANQDERTAAVSLANAINIPKYDHILYSYRCIYRLIYSHYMRHNMRHCACNI